MKNLRAILTALVIVTCTLILCGQSALAQGATVKAHIELLHDGHKVKNASNAVIWLTPVGTTVDAPVQTTIPKLEQRDKSFHPSLVVVPVGGKVEFPNRDPFFHNVFSLYEGKRFDLGLYESGTTRFVQFDRPGISYIFCNIHAQMSAVVIALNTPYFGLSGPNGEITLTNVPTGRYEMQVFHASAQPEDLHAYNREITIGEAPLSLGEVRLHENDVVATHKNKYGHDYDPPSPDSPVYGQP